MIFVRIEMLAHPSGLMQTTRDPELSHVRFELNHPDTHKHNSAGLLDNTLYNQAVVRLGWVQTGW